MKRSHNSDEIQPSTFSIVAFFLILIGSGITMLGWIRILDSIRAEFFLFYFIDLEEFILLILNMLLFLIEKGIIPEITPILSFLDFIISMSYESGLLYFSFIFLGIGLLVLILAAIKTIQMKIFKAISVIFICSLVILCIVALILCIIGFNDVKISLENVRNLQLLKSISSKVNGMINDFCKYLSLYLLMSATYFLQMNPGLNFLLTLIILLLIATIFLDFRYKALISRDSKTNLKNNSY